MGEQQQLAGLQLVAFRDVLENVVYDAHAGLRQLAERLPSLGDQERKRQLLQHLQTTRQRLQRLHVCAQWGHKAKAVNTCREVLKASQDHGAALMHAADELFRVNEELQFSRAPLFDVSSALHIMQTGNYRLLPSVIEDELQQPGQRLERPGEASAGGAQARQRDAQRRLDFLLRSKLLSAELPPGLRVLRVRDGRAWVAAAGGQYAAQLTLVPAPRDDVVLAKYRPPGEEAAAAPKEEPEVAQPVAAAAGGPPDNQPSTSAAAAPAAGADGRGRQGADAWRWQLLSCELLPAAAARDPPPLLPQQRQWLQQHLEQRMWAAGDAEQLARLGRAGWVALPELPPAARERQSRGSAAPAPSGSALPGSSLAPSQQPAGSKGKQAVKEEPGLEASLAAGEQPQQQLDAGDDAAALPPWAGSPLALMHGVLSQAGGRLALFSLLLSEARQLEGGRWQGCLKLSRAGPDGLRLAYWLQQPVAAYADVEALREGRPLPPGAAAAASSSAPPPPAVEVALKGDGSLAVASSPPLRHPMSGEPVRLQLPLDAAAALDADRLLLQAAAASAALQLAAVQAVLQRGGGLAAGGVHCELALPPPPPPCAPPSPPALQLWAAGGLQLSLSVQLRSGRLLLAAGPGLLEGGEGGAAAAAVQAAQQQLDSAPREALAQPTPAGASRAMQAARLAAAILARLSLRLATRARIAAAAAAAAAAGLQRTTLPPRLLQQHLERMGPLLEPLSPHTLTLALPAFPPPRDMPRWVAQRRRRAAAAAASAGCGPPLDTGATRCCLLLDFGAAERQAADHGGGGGERGEVAAEGGGGGRGEAAEPRLLFAVCACTGRGTVTRIRQLAELPATLLAEARAAAPPSGGPAARRKRRVDEEEGSAAAAAARPAAAAAGGGGLGLDLAALLPWLRRRASWAALRAQMQLLPVQYAEELPLPSAQQAQQAQQHSQPSMRLPKAPALDELERWAAARLAATGGAAAAAAPPPRKPVAAMRLAGDEAAAAGGAWQVDVASAYFGGLRAVLEGQGVALAPPAADAAHIEAHAGGLTLRYSLQRGHSMLTAITDLVRLGMLHVSLTRLAGRMAANPLAAARRRPPSPAAEPNGTLAPPEGNSLDFLTDQPAPEHGKAANGRLPGSPSEETASEARGSAAAAAAGRWLPGLVWPLPGCGSVRLAEAGLTHLLLLVEPPPQPQPASGAGAGDAPPPPPPPPPMRVTVRWANTLAEGGESGGEAAGGEAGRAPAAAAGGGGSLAHIRCQLASEPALPPALAAALAAQLEADRADLFLDSLCLAAHSAAAAAAALGPEAQRAAGLLPGALHVLAPGSGGGGAPESSGAGLCSALRLRVRLQHGERAAILSLGFHAAGCVLLQLQPAATAAATAAAAAWLPPLWQRLARGVPRFEPLHEAGGGGGDDGQQGAEQPAANKRHVRQAWVHREGLAAALSLILAAVGAAQPCPSAAPS